VVLELGQPIHLYFVRQGLEPEVEASESGAYMSRSALAEDNLLRGAFKKSTGGYDIAGNITYHFSSLFLISLELAAGTAFLRQHPKCSFKTYTSPRASDESQHSRRQEGTGLCPSGYNAGAPPPCLQQPLNGILPG